MLLQKKATREGLVCTHQFICYLRVLIKEKWCVFMGEHLLHSYSRKWFGEVISCLNGGWRSCGIVGLLCAAAAARGVVGAQRSVTRCCCV